MCMKNWIWKQIGFRVRAVVPWLLAKMNREYLGAMEKNVNNNNIVIQQINKFPECVESHTLQLGSNNGSNAQANLKTSNGAKNCWLINIRRWLFEIAGKSTKHVEIPLFLLDCFLKNSDPLFLQYMTHWGRKIWIEKFSFFRFWDKTRDVSSSTQKCIRGELFFLKTERFERDFTVIILSI